MRAVSDGSSVAADPSTGAPLGGSVSANPAGTGAAELSLAWAAVGTFGASDKCSAGRRSADMVVLEARLRSRVAWVDGKDMVTNSKAKLHSPMLAAWPLGNRAHLTCLIRRGGNLTRVR